MDDYYELLGVDHDATTDDIRAAYRTRKDGIANKSEVAKLNKAWNVLSDPYQRGRYDEQRANRDDIDVEIDDDDVVTRTNGTSNRAKSSDATPVGRTRGGRPMPPPTLSPPAGTTWPAPKQRVMAMAIDLGVILVLFIIGSYVVTPAIAKAAQPHTVDKLDAISKQIDDLTQQRKDAKDAGDTAKSEALKTQIDDKQKEYNDESAKLTPIVIGVAAGVFFLGFLYLAIPSIVSGRTFGKKLRGLKVVREDGSPMHALDVFRRYGVLVLVTFVLYVIALRELAGVIVLVGVTTWMRNPNMQGLHDRFSHTLVVSDATD
jgi:curved DNA-binding protein CbpA